MSFCKAKLPKTKGGKNDPLKMPQTRPLLPCLQGWSARLILLEAYARAKLMSQAPRKYTPSSLSRFVLQHVLRSRLKSFLTLAIALGFMLAAGWIRQTMELSQLEVERLYNTTVVEADIIPTDPFAASTGATPGRGTGFVYLKTIESILNSGFVKSSVLEADTAWYKSRTWIPKTYFLETSRYMLMTARKRSTPAWRIQVRSFLHRGGI